MSVLSKAGEHLREFLQKGVVPPAVEPLLEDLLNTLVGAIEKIEMRVELGYGIAAGARVAKGGVARVHGSGSARSVFQQDIAPLLREHLRTALMTTADLLELLRGKWKDASAELSVTPEQLRSATP
jgi:hypothetical protein